MELLIQNYISDWDPMFFAVIGVFPECGNIKFFVSISITNCDSGGIFLFYFLATLYQHHGCCWIQAISIFLVHLSSCRHHNINHLFRGQHTLSTCVSGWSKFPNINLKIHFLIIVSKWQSLLKEEKGELPIKPQSNKKQLPDPPVKKMLQIFSWEGQTSGLVWCADQLIFCSAPFSTTQRLSHIDPLSSLGGRSVFCGAQRVTSRVIES